MNLHELWVDARYAIRSWRSNPGFTAVALLVLGLAIGANTVAFTFFNEFVLKPLPIPGAEHHVHLRARYVEKTGERFNTMRWTKREFEVLRTRLTQFTRFYTFVNDTITVTDPQPRNLQARFVSTEYHKELGTPLLMGIPGVVLSHETWQTLFAGDPAILGKPLRTGDREYTITGVAPQGYTGIDPAAPNVWLPLEPTDTRTVMIGAFGPAEADLQPLVTSLNGLGERRIEQVSAQPRSHHIPMTGETALVFLPVEFGFLLLIVVACANLANLLLARGVARKREISIRLALGASRGRVVRQLVTESVVLGLAAAVLGFGLTMLATPAVHEFLFGVVSRAGIMVPAPRVNWLVFSFSAATGIGVGVLFGLAPALQVTRNASPGRARGALVVIQVAASTLLLVLASMLIADSQWYGTMPSGFDYSNLYQLTVKQGGTVQLDGRFGTVARAERIPLQGELRQKPAVIGDRAIGLNVTRVDEAYIPTVGIRLVQGRNLQKGDAGVAVVSARTARTLWPGANAIGQSFRLMDDREFGVVGVVEDVVSGFFFQGLDATHAYVPSFGEAQHLVRSPLQTGATIQELQRQCAQQDKVCEVRPIADWAWMQRQMFTIAGGIALGLGVLAILLTCIGLNGLVAYSVVQRTKEIGIRMALGATSANVVRLLVSQTGLRVLMGIAIGTPLAIFPLLYLRELASMVPVDHTPAYVLTPLFLLSVAMFAAGMPARRATRIEPSSALRHE